MVFSHIIWVHGGQNGGQWPSISDFLDWLQLEATCKNLAYYINY